jgi:hypothetical protein
MLHVNANKFASQKNTWFHVYQFNRTATRLPNKEEQRCMLILVGPQGTYLGTYYAEDGKFYCEEQADEHEPFETVWWAILTIPPSEGVQNV